MPANDRSMTDVDNLCPHFPLGKGTVSPGERYRRYYCCALGILPTAFGRSLNGTFSCSPLHIGAIRCAVVD